MRSSSSQLCLLNLVDAIRHAMYETTKTKNKQQQQREGHKPLALGCVW